MMHLPIRLDQVELAAAERPARTHHPWTYLALVLFCVVLGSCGPRFDLPDWDEVDRRMPREWTYTGSATVDEVVIVIDGLDGSVAIEPYVGSGSLLEDERLMTDLSWEGISLSMSGTAGSDGLRLVGVDSSGRAVLQKDVQPNEFFSLPQVVMVSDDESGSAAGPFFDVVSPGLHSLTISTDGNLGGLSINVSADEYAGPRNFELVLDEASCTEGLHPAATGTLTNLTDEHHSYRIFVQFGPIGEQEYQVALVEDLQPGGTTQWTAHPADLSNYDLCLVDTLEIDDFPITHCSKYHVTWCPQPEPAS